MTSSVDNCPISFDAIHELIGRNVTQEVAAEWPCDVRQCWVNIEPLVKLSRWLLSYGSSAIIVAGLCLNTLSLIVLTRKHMRKKMSNLYLAFLAVSDNCVLIFNFMIGVLRSNNESVNRSFQNSMALCTFHAVVFELFNLLSVWIIVTFTVERFLMVRFPLRARTWSPNRAIIAPILVAFIVTVVAMHKIAFVGFEGYSVFGYKACHTKRKTSDKVIYAHIAVKSWIPTLIIVSLNIYIMAEVIRNQRKRKEMVQTLISRTDENATKLLLIVSSSYVLFVLPVGVLQTAEVFWHATRMVPPGSPTYSEFMITKIRMKWARSFFFFFYQFNFVINFFLYVATSKLSRFRANMKRLVGMRSVSTFSTKENGDKIATIMKLRNTTIEAHTKNKAAQLERNSI